MPTRSIAIRFEEKKIDSIFSELDQGHLPGAAVGIAVGGKPVYRKGFGLANIELPILLSPSVRMRIHSTTKHFTCLAYMLLCENGLANVDDPVRKHLPELHPITHAVTIRQLMGHTSGLRDAHDLNWQFSGIGHRVSSAELLSLYREIDDVNFAPTTTWRYCNGGYLLLSAVIERITGQSLEDVFRERIFEPVGMYDTQLRRFDTDFVPNSASMHMTKPTGGYDRSYLGTASSGEGGIVSTVDDMLRWLAHMDTPWVGSVATWEVMKASQILSNGSSTGYGLGLMTGQYRGVDVLWHSGGGQGSNSQMLKVPAARLDVAIMVNRHDVSGMQIANQILDTCVLGLETAIEPSRVRNIYGTYCSPTTGRVIQLSTSAGTPPLIKEDQQIASIDGLDQPFESSDRVLRPAGIFGFVKQAIMLFGDDSENPASIRFSDFGNIDHLVLTKPIERIDVGVVAGHYRSVTTRTEATISDSEVGPRLITTGQFGSAFYAIEPLARDIWRATSISGNFWLGGILTFDGDASAFRFSNYRTTALPFRRCP